MQNPLTAALRRVGLFWDDLPQMKVDLLEAIDRRNRDLLAGFSKGV